MRFADIIGQKELIDKLKDLVDHNRLSHAILLIGKEGCGTLPLALAFASYIIEAEEKDSGGAANNLFGDPAPPSFEATQKADKYIHPDIHFSYPVIPKKSGDKPISTDYITEWRNFLQQMPYGNVYDWLQSIGAENKQGNITSRECEEILRKLQLKSFESKHKILILWMPKYLGNEGNKLLKLIEEPPRGTIFILVSDGEEGVLPTIISRCQTIRIPILETDDISNALMTRCSLSKEKAIQIAGLAEGNYREALQLTQHSDSDWQAVLREWLNTMVKNDTVGQIKWADQMGQNGRENQKQFLLYFIHLAELSIRLSATGATSIAASDQEKDFAERLNKLCDVSQLEAISSELDKAIYYIERNANAKMLFSALGIKLFHIIRNRVVPEIR
ncbi:MAG: ATP-binding protein [Bacteroidota bacterium]|jgi:DNA polymerase-3 subunit delta'